MLNNDTSIETHVPSSSNFVTANPMPPRLEEAGAVVAEEGPFTGLPLHYGWVADEQEKYEAGQGFAYLGPVGVVKVTGVDRSSWLTSLFSQVLTGLSPDDSVEALLLDPQGRIEFQMAVKDDGDTTWLVTDPQDAVGLADFLDSMRFMMRVDVEDVSDDFTLFSTDNEQGNGESLGSIKDLGAWVADHGGVQWVDPWPGVTKGGAQYFTGNHPSRLHQFRLYVLPKKWAGEFIDLLTSQPNPLSPVGVLAANATRVAAWRPLSKFEVDDRAMPAELDLLRSAVYLEKGCYRGQESVARIVNLGRPPRRLTFLHLDGSGAGLPEEGAAVALNGRQVGHVTSVAEHWELGPIALALIKRNLNPSEQVSVDGVDAAQEVIVPVDGKSDHSPTERPGVGLRRLATDKPDIRTTGPGAKR